MATVSPATLRETERGHTLSSTRLLVTGAVTAAVVFVLCWISTFVPFSSPTHAYIGMFTSANESSAKALVEGTLWSLVFGAVVGGLIALIYNTTAPLAARKEQSR